MAKRRMPGRNKVGRPATGSNPTIAIRWPPTLLDALERYAQDQAIDRSSALRQIVAKYLIAQGVLEAGTL